MKMDTTRMNGEGSSEDTLHFFPQEFWGLNYYFQVYNKMYIQDVLQMTEYSLFPGAYSYKNHPIYKVDVMGVIVKVAQNQKCFMYSVDDGTGVIVCCCWKMPFYSETTGDETWRGLPKLLRQRVKNATREKEVNQEGYSLGDVVHVRGKIKIFREDREIVATSHSLVLDPLAELMRLAELPKLYKQSYDRPFILPYKVQQAVAMVKEEEKTGMKSEKRVVQELMSTLQEFFSSCSYPQVAIQEVMDLKLVKHICSQVRSGERSDKSLVEQTLHELEMDGHVYNKNDASQLYEVLSCHCALDLTVKEILQRECSKSKYAEKGCHYLHVLDELHNTHSYSKIQKKCVQTCLDKLEAQSDVIRTTQYHYMCSGV